MDAVIAKDSVKNWEISNTSEACIGSNQLKRMCTIFGTLSVFPIMRSTPDFEVLSFVLL